MHTVHVCVRVHMSFYWSICTRVVDIETVYVPKWYTVIYSTIFSIGQLKIHAYLPSIRWPKSIGVTVLLHAPKSVPWAWLAWTASCRADEDEDGEEDHFSHYLYLESCSDLTDERAKATNPFIPLHTIPAYVHACTEFMAACLIVHILFEPYT